MNISSEDIHKYWIWRINDHGWQLLHFKNKSEMMTWEYYEETLNILKSNLENNVIPLLETGDLTTYYSWKNQPDINKHLKMLPSESRMKDYYKNLLRERFAID